MVITRTVEMHAQLVGYDFKKKGLPTDKNIAVENSKVSNDYFWKTNKYTDQDVFGRTLDLTALINKPDGYLKGSLSDTEDVDYYEFNITEYRALSFAKDTYNKDITITLDHIPEGYDYEMVLYDEEGNQVGIGKENGNGGLSITIPNWNSDNRGYTVKVQAKNGSTVNPDAEYHLSFQTTQADKSHGAYQEMAEVQKYAGTVRKQMQEGLTDTEETRAIKEIRQKYKAYYTEQMEKLHQKQAEDVMQGGAVPDDAHLRQALLRVQPLRGPDPPDRGRRGDPPAGRTPAQHLLRSAGDGRDPGGQRKRLRLLCRDRDRPAQGPGRQRHPLRHRGSAVRGGPSGAAERY